MKLQGKTAIVTGAARGLGRAYALRLAALGADVAVVDIDLEAAAEFGEVLGASSVAEEVRQLGRRGMGVQADLGQREQAFAAVEQIMAAFGRVDILVNNVGGAITPSTRSQASVIPEQDLALLMNANFLSTVNCCQAAVPAMKRQGGGVIVNTSSQVGSTTYADGILSGYAAAKAAVVHYTRYLAAELRPHGIRANCIAPGVMLTSRIVAQAAARGVATDAEIAKIPLRRVGQVEDCAGVVEFMVTDLSRYVTGQVISVCGGVVLTPT